MAVYQKVELRDLFPQAKTYFGKEVEVCGWVRTIRDSKTVGFIELNDGTDFKNIQIVFQDNNIENFREITAITVGSSICAKGKLLETPGAKQPFELQAEKIELIGLCDREYPLQKKRHTFEYLRTIAHLRPRSNTFSAVFKVRSLLAFALHKFFNERGFVYVNTPIITGSDCEGAGEMFRVLTLDTCNIKLNSCGKPDFSGDFFGKETNLTVSGQLGAEAYAMAFGKVYTFGPTFRAEKSGTPRHAAEFWMIEPEIAFADLNDDMNLAEEMVKYIINYVRENAPDEMDFFNKFIDTSLFEKLENVASSAFERITYTEAVKLLEKSGRSFEYPVRWGSDLQTEHERYITEEVFKRPVFVTDYPKDIKAFYMRMNDDGKTVAAADLLVPGVGEIIGGSQREERFDNLIKRMKEMKLREEDYWWYLDLRKYGGTKHAGFGLGFERAIMYMTGMQNIRDVIPFPRTYGSAEF